MKFGFNIPAAPDPHTSEPLRRAFDVCARAEALGFDFGVVAQHRFTAGYPLSPWVTLAARLADGWLAGFGDRLPAVAARAAAYRDQAAGHGRAAAVCLLRLVGIAASRDEVERGWLPGVVEMMRGYRRAGAPGEKSRRAATSLRERRELTLAAFDDMLIAGTPADCVEQLKACQQLTGCEYVLATFRGPDADEQLDLFGREVLPAFT